MCEPDSLDQLPQRLKAEADSLLHQRGILEILRQFGQPHVSGSYALDLMTWRDLDLYLDAPSMAVTRFLQLGLQLAGQLCPWKMFFTNHRDFPSTEGITGLYYGIRLGELSRGAWKIDLWALDSTTCAERLAHCDRIAQRLRPEHRTAILRIKSALWDHPEYRKTITSQHIYEAVIENGVRSTEEFWHSRAPLTRHP